MLKSCFLSLYSAFSVHSKFFFANFTLPCNVSQKCWFEGASGSHLLQPPFRKRMVANGRLAMAFSS